MRSRTALMAGCVMSATALVFAGAWAAGCVGETGSKRFTFEAAAGGVARPVGGPVSFVNQRGWAVTLTKADMTLGPVYLNVLAPLRTAERGFSASGSRRLLDWVIRPAWAGGEGHLGSGRVVGEVLGQVTFSALSPELVAFPVRGSIAQEQVRTADVWFYPAPGVDPEATKINTVALDVAGTAERAGERIRFRGALVLNDAWMADASPGSRSSAPISDVRKVRGIAASFMPVEGGRLEVRVDVTRFFRGADFGELRNNPADADGTKVLVQSKTGKVTTDPVMNNVYQGLRESSGAYFVRWVTPD